MARIWHRLLLALVLPAALLVPSAGPAAAADRFVGCTWSPSDRTDWSCTSRSFTSIGAAVYSTCWRYRPSSKSYIQARFGGRWYRQTENATVKIFRSASCSSRYPWMTKLKVGVVAGDAYAKQSYRLVMPATSKYTRTVYRFNVCVLPAASDGTCW